MQLYLYIRMACITQTTAILERKHFKILSHQFRWPACPLSIENIVSQQNSNGFVTSG